MSPLTLCLAALLAGGDPYAVRIEGFEDCARFVAAWRRVDVGAQERLAELRAHHRALGTPLSFSELDPPTVESDATEWLLEIERVRERATPMWEFVDDLVAEIVRLEQSGADPERLDRLRRAGRLFGDTGQVELETYMGLYAFPFYYDSGRIQATGKSERAFLELRLDEFGPIEQLAGQVFRFDGVQVSTDSASDRCLLPIRNPRNRFGPSTRISW